MVKIDQSNQQICEHMKTILSKNCYNNDLNTNTQNTYFLVFGNFTSR